MKFYLWFLFFIFSVSSLACAPNRIKMEPVRVQVLLKAEPETEEKAEYGIDLNQPPEKLFDLGYDAYVKNNRGLALAYFKTVIERHPESKPFVNSAYNAGLIFHHLGQYEDAFRMYRKVETSKAGRKDILDARFRILDALYQLSRWKDMQKRVRVMRKEYDSLSTDDAIELQVREGVAAYHLGERKTAEETLEAAFHDYKIGLRREDVLNEYPGAMAAYYLGLIWRDRTRAENLLLGSDEIMLEAMGRKAQKLLKSQDYFLQSIEQDNAYWATASGAQIGQLYRDFWLSINEAPAPDELSGKPEEIRMYRCVLAGRAEVLLKKAMRVYDRTLQIGERLRVKNKWTEKSKTDLKEIEGMYLKSIRECEEVLPEKFRYDEAFRKTVKKLQ